MLKFLLTEYEYQTKYLFIGLIIGSIPLVIKNGNLGKSIRLKHLVIALTTFSIGIILTLAERLSFSGSVSPTFLNLFIAGFFMSIGIVVPGVSSTVILMILGVYSTYIDALATLNVLVLIPLFLGVVVGGYMFLKIIRYLLNTRKIATYFGILGFSVGSLFTLFPGFKLDITSALSLIFMILGFLLTSNIKVKS